MLNDGTQSGQFNDMVSLAVSKQWSNVMTATWDVGYRFTRDPRGSAGADIAFHMAGQFRTGIGLISFPECRIQPMTE